MMISQRRAPRIVVAALIVFMLALLSACGVPGSGLVSNAKPSLAAGPTPIAAEPSTALSPEAAAVPFLWPEPLPDGLRVDVAQSSIGPDGWTLYLINPNELQDQVWIRGGYNLADQPGPSSRTMQVRGVEGNASTTGAGWGLTWTEGVVYNVGGFLRSADDTVKIAETLQRVDEETFRRRLGEAG